MNLFARYYVTQLLPLFKLLRESRYYLFGFCRRENTNITKAKLRERGTNNSHKTWHFDRKCVKFELDV